VAWEGGWIGEEGVGGRTAVDGIVECREGGGWGGGGAGRLEEELGVSAQGGGDGWGVGRRRLGSGEGVWG